MYWSVTHLTSQSQTHHLLRLLPVKHFASPADGTWMDPSQTTGAVTDTPHPRNPHAPSTLGGLSHRPNTVFMIRSEFSLSVHRIHSWLLCLWTFFLRSGGSAAGSREEHSNLTKCERTQSDLLNFSFEVKPTSTYFIMRAAVWVAIPAALDTKPSGQLPLFN